MSCFPLTTLLRQELSKFHLGTPEAVFDLLNDSYVYSTAIRLRRISERGNGIISLLNVLDEIQACPQLMSQEDPALLCDDIAVTETLSDSVRKYVDKYVAHHDRKREPIGMIFADLKQWTAVLQSIFRRYYGAIKQSDVDLILHHSEDPMKIFTFAWIRVSPGIN